MMSLAIGIKHALARAPQCKMNYSAHHRGVFLVKDSTCGIPPCPSKKAWDFNSHLCQPCKNLSKRLEPLQYLDDTESSVYSTSRRLGSHTPEIGSGSHNIALEKRVQECDAFNVPKGTTYYMPNNATAWVHDDGTGGAHAQGPTADTIATGVGASAAFQAAWEDSFINKNSAQEITTIYDPVLRNNSISTSSWIYANTTNTKKLFFRRAQSKRSAIMNRAKPPASPGAIDLVSPESNFDSPPPADWVIVATFQTHPVRTLLYGKPANPTPAEHANAWIRGVPGIVISKTGLTGYGPKARALLNAPVGYPGMNTKYPGLKPAGTPLGTWKPKPAPGE
ncbi:hypothetical protein DXG01_005591 [Tephrocybe rancida]|nr:hypothetical protein DXG01_005591 [Tephrocybe rancida]